MLERSNALDLVSARLTEMSPAEDKWVVVDESTIEKPYGWIFFYNSRKFVETRQAIYRLAGNGPVIVNKITGSVRFFGSTPSVEQIIEAYEREMTETN
jgi:hypothetical protein